jgi:protein involved in sex pheromone biosynthesis
MGKKLIPDEIREKVSEIVEKFNQQELKKIDARYIAKFQGRFLYLDRIAYGNKGPVIRMEYFREIDKWEFAIFKWSSETYDPDEYMFPGSEFLDGTVEGAMRAGMSAYPV